jgi:hypothetical protein
VQAGSSARQRARFAGSGRADDRAARVRRRRGRRHGNQSLDVCEGVVPGEDRTYNAQLRAVSSRYDLSHV